MNYRKGDAKRARAAGREVKDIQPPTLAGCKGEITRVKHKSDAFYHHVNFDYDWLKRFHIMDVVMIVVAVVAQEA